TSMVVKVPRSRRKPCNIPGGTPLILPRSDCAWRRHGAWRKHVRTNRAGKNFFIDRCTSVPPVEIGPVDLICALAKTSGLEAHERKRIRFAVRQNLGDDCCSTVTRR